LLFKTHLHASASHSDAPFAPGCLAFESQIKECCSRTNTTSFTATLHASELFPKMPIHLY
ncbi:hypothetical protein X975_16798, partial [Stegodyphus mimosarum]